MDIHKFRLQLKRYLRQQSNETEKAVIEAWYKSYQPNEVQPLDALERARVRQAVKSRIDKATRPTYMSYLRIAAAIIIFAVGGLTFFILHRKSTQSSPLITIQTAPGSIKEIHLPDSSVIWVNAGSRLRFPQSFSANTREIYLDEGEAFFEVRRNVHKPFIVHTASLNVQVLGTSFNISAYRQLQHVKVTVATGKVAVTREKRLLSMLLPGQQLLFSKPDSTFSQQNVNSSHIQSWHTGDTYLDQASFTELALVFKNLSGLTLKPGNEAVSGYRFSLRLQKSLPPDETLKVISQIHNTRYRKEANDIIIY